VIANPDPMAYNEPGKEPSVKISTKPLTEMPSSLKIPAMSVSLYTFETKN
jgi:hypothetical protein